MSDKRISIAAIALVIFGTLMIFSAEMGIAAGDTKYLTGVVIRQTLFALAGIAAYFFMCGFRTVRVRLGIFFAVYFVIMFLLLACRFSGMINGAYAWLNFGAFTIQPSEFAKAFMIVFGARLLGYNRSEKNLVNLYIYGAAAFVYFFIIFVIQHDLGSSIVLLVICYCVALIPPYPEYKRIQKWMSVLILFAVAGALFLMSPFATNIMKKYADNYMVGRFLAAADPFLYQYDNGYHLIMSLVSFANGGLFGLGYGNSIHKYMNFPNPSNDFILPVIVEEFGIIGFAGLIIAYGFMLYPIIAASLRCEKTVSKIIFLGVFMYFITHFILNVGGVSGLIPLTGVPLLLISSGGSSLVASMMSLGMAQSELINMEKENADHRRKVQKNPA